MVRPEKHTPGIYPREARSGTVYDAVAMVDGKQKWSRGHKTKRAAQAARDEMRVAMRNGQLGAAPARLTLREYFTNRYMPSAEAGLGSKSSLKDYRYMSAWIVARLGDVRLAQLTPVRVEEFKDQLRASGMAPTTQNLIFAHLKRALRKAVAWELISRNPCDRVEAPRRGYYDPPMLDTATLQRIVSQAEGRQQGSLVYLAISTGMRWGEIAALQWADVDFGAGNLRIPKAKTRRGIRAVALGPTTLERLQAHRLDQMRRYRELGQPPASAVFLDEYGKPWSQANFLYRHWRHIRAAAGVPAMRFHDLRHAQATLLARAGVNPSVAQARLGHASPLMTLGIYTHIDASDQAPAAAAVEGLLGA